MDRKQKQQLIEELDFWSQKSEQKNLTAEEEREINLNIWEIQQILEIEEKKERRRNGKK